MSSDYGKDQTPGVWGKQEGCDGLPDTFCDPELRYESESARSKPKRTTRETREGEGTTPRGKIVGGTLSQLIEDCKGQIAGNEQIIDTLQGVNETLQERIGFYQRLMEQIQGQQE